MQPVKETLFGQAELEKVIKPHCRVSREKQNSLDHGSE